MLSAIRKGFILLLLSVRYCTNVPQMSVLFFFYYYYFEVWLHLLSIVGIIYSTLFYLFTCV